jgi:hypothetical protein
LDNNAIKGAFLKIKEDMTRLNQELYDLKSEQKRLLKENSMLKQQSNVDPMMISQIVRETIRNVQPKKNNDIFIKKINKKRKSLIKSRILQLASNKNLTTSEIKDIIVDQEGLCSKATFYRYITKLKSRNQIDQMLINDEEIMISIA